VTPPHLANLTLRQVLTEEGGRETVGRTAGRGCGRQPIQVISKVLMISAMSST